MPSTMYWHQGSGDFKNLSHPQKDILQAGFNIIIPENFRHEDTRGIEGILSTLQAY
jgi:hypothetical protein